MTSSRRAERERAAAFLDLVEGRGPVATLDDAAIAALLRSARRIAIVGASADSARPSHGVMAYLQEVGYECVPVNPNERQVLGAPAYATLGEAVAATGPVDVVDVFRRSDECPAHAEESVAVGARCLWLQVGVISWAAARIAADHGVGVVMDRCTMVEHRRLLGR